MIFEYRNPERLTSYAATCNINVAKFSAENSAIILFVIGYLTATKDMNWSLNELIY